MHSVLVTGGAGFIGSHLIERLLCIGGFRVTIVDDFNDFYLPTLKRENVAQILRRGSVDVIAASLLDSKKMQSLFESKSFDTIIHLAARAGVRPSLIDPMLYQSVNVEGTYRLLECARKYRVPRFVFGSSSSVYGVTSKVPFVESDPLQTPASPYAATKIAGEAACHVYSHLYGIQVVCLRFFTVFGPRQRPDLAIHRFVSRMLAGEPIPLYGDGSSARDYTYVDDIVGCIVSCLTYEGKRFDIFNVGGEEPIRLDALVQLIARVCDVEPRIQWLPMQAGDMSITWANITKARQSLGYEPRVGREEGVRRFVDWFRMRNKTYELADLA
jgi:UDP-glucuronate 4-epimerase